MAHSLEIFAAPGGNLMSAQANGLGGPIHDFLL